MILSPNPIPFNSKTKHSKSKYEATNEYWECQYGITRQCFKLIIDHRTVASLEHGTSLVGEFVEALPLVINFFSGKIYSPIQ